MIKVFKFGGACLKDEAHIQNASDILKQFKGEKILLVVSAIDKTTNALEKVVNAYYAGNDEAVNLVEAIKHEHLNLCQRLGISDPIAVNEVEDSFIDALWILEDEIQDSYEYIYDQVVSIGEMASSKIMFHFLKQNGLSAALLDVRDVMKTSEDYRSALVQWDSTQELVQKMIPRLFEHNDIIVTQGFIGSTNENNTTTLGREGSDYTASILAFCLDAESVHVWKDVDGIMTGDPKTYADAVMLDKLSFDEAIEMCYFGAKVLHPKTIKPIQNKGIPLYVRPFGDVSKTGTFISNTQPSAYPPIVIQETNQALVEIGVKDFSFIAENHLSEIFSLLTDLKVKVFLMRNTALKFIFSTKDDEVKLKKLLARLSDTYEVNIINSLTLLTVRHGDMASVKIIAEREEFIFEEQYGDTIQVVFPTA